MIFCPVKYTQSGLCPISHQMPDTISVCVSQVGHKAIELHNDLKYKGLGKKCRKQL